MKRIFIIIMCLASINISAQEEMYYIQDDDTISFEVTEDYYVSYNTNVANLLDSGLIRLIERLSDTSAIVSIPNIVGRTFAQRKHKIDSIFGNVFYFIEPVLMYEDSTIQMTHGILMIQAEDDSVINSVLSGYTYTYDTINVAGLMNYIIKISNISTIDLFALTTNNKDNKSLITIEPSFIRLIEPCSDSEFNDEYYPDQWAFNENHYANINIQKAWKITKGENIKVAVFDSGVQKNHPDLIDNIYGGFDATGYHTGGNPHNITDNHGTACAGIIGAKGNNEIGIVGVAPESKLIPIKMSKSLTDETFTLTDCQHAASLVYALNVGTRIFSNSWTCSGSISKCLKANINFCIDKPFKGKGGVFVFSSGNANKNKVSFPSSMGNVLSVGAMSPCGERKSTQSCDGNKKWGSNYGENLNLIAPGVSIYTTDRTGADGYNNSDYRADFKGTSAACPFVAGVAVLVLSVNPDLTQSEVRYIIESTCTKIQPENNPTAYNYLNTNGHPNGTWNNRTGYGLVNAYEAVELALAMACNVNDLPIVRGNIAENTTISTVTIGCGELTIDSGVTLTLTSTLRMAKGSKIIVRPGAKLYVNGGTITSACDGEYWDGIILEGNSSEGQNQTYQGYVVLSNALIENAKNAISLIGENENWGKTGGIIKATNTIFKNNRRSIEFMSYGENTNTNSASYFRNCTFTWDDDLLPNESTSLSHMTMYQVRGVEVSGCTFKDERTSTTGMTTHGILTDQSGFNVKEYLIMPGHNGGNLINKTTNFENLTYGIRAMESGERLCSVKRSVFDDNEKGAYITNTNNLYVQNNTFNVKSILHGMGLCVQNSTNYTIKNNDFVGTNSYTTTAGLQIVSSGADDNLVNLNRFQNLYAGTQTLGTNYGMNAGLELNCNSFSGCQIGIDIPSFPIVNATGIKSTQGSQDFSSGNIFTNNNSNVINNGVNNVIYYYYTTQENPNYISLNFLPILANNGVSCGIIGNNTTPNFPLLSNGYEIEESEEEELQTRESITSTVLEYINQQDYQSAENLLNTDNFTAEEKNDYRLYSSYIQEYENSYKIPTEILINLSTKETNIGLIAKNMLYFKGISTDFHPTVIVEDEETSSYSSIVNKTKEQITEKGIEITEEYILTPNPANNEVEIKTANREKNTEQHITTTENTIKQVTILDLQGKELKTFDNTTTFNIAFLKNGTYIVKIKDSENRLHYQKLVRQ